MQRKRTAEERVPKGTDVDYRQIPPFRFLGGGVVHFNPVTAKLATVADLGDSDVQKLVALCEDVRVVPSKHDILSEGERPDHVHVIIEGWAARYKTLANGSRQIVAFLIPGDFCDLHVAVLGRMDHGIVALTRCRVAYIPSRDLDGLTSAHIGLTKALWWATLVDESVLREWVLNVGRRDAYERIAHLLCEMHARMKMVGLVEDDRLALPLTQEELADATGMTPVHTNRTLQRLRNEKLIEIGGGILTLLDVDRLRKAAGFNPNYLHIQRRVAVPR